MVAKETLRRVSSSQPQKACRVRGEPGEASEQEMPPKCVTSPPSTSIKCLSSGKLTLPVTCEISPDSLGHDGPLPPGVIFHYHD